MSTIRKLADRLFLIDNGASNSLVVLTDLGVVVVDPGAKETNILLESIRAITADPVVTLINTSANIGRTGGNQLFSTAVDIVAHENTRRHMETQPEFAGPNMNFLPKLMFKQKMTIGTGRERIDLYHFGAGHSDGDAWVVFPDLGVAYVGDLFPDKQLPIIDAQSGGSGLGYADSLERGIQTLRDIKVIVTGRNGTASLDDLEQFRSYLKEFRDIVVDSFNHGMGVNETVERWTLSETADFPPAPTDRLRNNVEYMFGELTK